MDFPLEKIKKPEFKTLEAQLLAGALTYQVGLKAHGIMVLSASGNITLVFSSGAAAQVPVGQAVNTKENSDQMELTSIVSDIPGDSVVILYGDGHLTSSVAKTAIASPLAGDGYSLAVGNKLYQPGAQGVGPAASITFATKGFPVATFAITGNVGGGAGEHVLVQGQVQGNIAPIPVIDLQTGSVYWDGKIPRASLGAQYHFQFNTSAIDNVWIANNMTTPASCYPSFGNGVIGPYKPV